MKEKSIFPCRAARVSTYLLSAVLIALALLLALNLFVGALPVRYTELNVAQLKEYKLSGTARDWLAQSNGDVELYLICAGGNASVDRDLRGFLQEIEDASDRVTLSVIDSRSGDSFIKQFGGVWPSDNSVIVASELAYGILSYDQLFHYYNKTLKATMSYEEYSGVLTSYEKAGDTASMQSFAQDTVYRFDGEAQLINLISCVLSDKTVNASVLVGKCATDLPYAFERELLQSGFGINYLTELSELPADCELLVIHTPYKDLTSVEQNQLRAFLSDGGKLFITTSYLATNLPGYEAVLSDYGLHFANPDQGYFIADSANKIQGEGSADVLFNAEVQSQHAATGSFKETFATYMAHEIGISEVEGVEQTKWLFTSDAGYVAKQNLSTGAIEENTSVERGKKTFGVIAEKQNGGQVLWLAASSALDSMYNSLSENNGNYKLISSALRYASNGGVVRQDLKATEINESMIFVNSTQFTILAIVMVLVLPLSIATTGIVKWTSRKKR